MSNALATLIERRRNEPEDWRYTDIEKLLKNVKPAVAAPKQNAMLAIKANAEHCLTFIDGQLQPHKMSGVSGSLQNGYNITLEDKSGFVELAFIGHKLVDEKLHLTVSLKANSEAVLIEHHQSTTVAAEITIALGGKSKLTHAKIMHAPNESPHFAETKVNVESGAEYRHFVAAMNSAVMRHEVDVSLAKDAACDVSGILLLQGHEHADILTRIHHKAPHGTSHQLFKAVVKDQARGVFQGKIAVAKDAQKTVGTQLCRTLLLSDQAEMDAKPELEIYADDVACSHGCAVGDLDRDAMFYLNSRGLSENEARALLLRAFIDEAVDTITNDDVREYVRNLTGVWMNG